MLLIFKNSVYTTAITSLLMLVVFYIQENACLHAWSKTLSLQFTFVYSYIHCRFSQWRVRRLFNFMCVRYTCSTEYFEIKMCRHNKRSLFLELLDGGPSARKLCGLMFFYVNDVTWPNQLRDNWHRSAELLASEMASVQYEMKQAYDGSSQVVKPLINTCH